MTVSFWHCIRKCYGRTISKRSAISMILLEHVYAVTHLSQF